ncbi:response regulator transcription factor [Acidobacteria bacterium AB60]|nr:response regulator transcription factor [Acidobacteria bacterium AB60]
MNSLRVLIVDDEPLIRSGIRHGLEAIPGIEVVAECDRGDEAVRVLGSGQIDLVLLDIQMHDCTGLDVVERIGPARMPAVIFVTAYDEYAVKAFELHALDYLLKPFDDVRLRQSIERARFLIEARRQTDLASQLQSLLDTRARRWPERLVVKEGERFDFVPVDSIEWIESANNYVQLHCGTRHHLLAESLTSLEARLNPARFLRIHRGRIVNLSRIGAIHPLLGGAYELELRSGTKLTSGRQYKNQIQELLRS